MPHRQLSCDVGGCSPLNCWRDACRDRIASHWFPWVALGITLVLSIGSSVWTVQAKEKSHPAPLPGTEPPSSYEVHGTFSYFRLPEGAVDLALRSSGAWATASSTSEKFDPNGAVDGNWTVQGWGKGHGWQNAKRHEYPCWLEIRLPRQEEIDTVVILTFPEVAHGINWAGLRNLDIQAKLEGKWVTLGGAASVRGNVKGTIVHRFPPLRTDGIRIVVLGANTGQQEDVFYDDDDFARILQVGIYRLRVPYPFVDESVSVQVEHGPRGAIAIYHDNLPIKPVNPSSPEYLAALLRKAGYGVTFLDSKALCVPEIFNHHNFDVFVQPYGAPFPVASMLYSFLASSGNLVTMGGHPFRQALMFSPTGKLIDAGYDPGITTTVGRQADYKLPFREQLGVFYTGYERFEDVSYVKVAPDQNVVTSSFQMNTHLKGEVAAALVGDRLSLEDGDRLTREGTFPEYANTSRKKLSNLVSVLNSTPAGVGFDYLSGYIFNWPRARWIPLVNAYDRLGRLRGSVVSLLANFGGPYRGSGWVFCGVENEDLFSSAHPEFSQTLLDALRYLTVGLGLHDLLPEMDCYYQGETVNVATTVENYQPHPRRVSVEFELIPSGTTAPAYRQRVDVNLPAGGNARPSVSWKPPHFDSDFYLIRARVYEGKRLIDASESALVVWDPKIIAQGTKVDFHNSYFHVEGRPELLLGSRTNGFQPHGQVDEDVLGWERQYAEMHDYGIRVFSPVFFSVYIPGLAWGEPQTPAIPAQLQRQMDAQVLLAQKHHLIFAPCIFFIAKYMAMENMGFSRRICEELGKRYASVPGIMFYIFDDGSQETPLKVFQEWSKHCVEGFASSGRHYIVLAETGGVAMERYGSEALSMPANGNYSPGHPELYRAMDMRAAGKSFHLSEFGVNSPGANPSDIDLHTYPGTNVSGSPTGDYSVYLMEPHLHFALGGSYVVNWVWKDTAHLIFPWGITHPNDYTPTPPLLAYRGESYFLRHFQPEFRFPKTLVVLPKAEIERNESTYAPYLNGILSALFDYSVQFATIDDTDLERIPVGSHVLIYPDPEFALPEVLAKLSARVEAGDDLFLSGDFTRPLEAGDERRTEFFRRLAGLKWLGDCTNGSEIPIEPVVGPEILNPYIGQPRSIFEAEDARVLATDPERHVIVATRDLGSGHVLFTSDASLNGTRRALDAFLKLRGVPTTNFSPKRPNRDIFEIPRAGGGNIYTLAATHPEGTGYTVNGPWIERPENYVLQVGGNRIDLPLGGYGVSLLAVRGDGTPDALEGQGTFRVDGATLLQAQPHVMVMALDDAPLQKSRAIALFSVGAGKVSISVSAVVDDVEVGDIEGGEFRPREDIPAHRADGRLEFQVNDLQARGVVLLCSKAEREQARHLLNGELR